MNQFSTTELSRMQATQERAMQDCGKILTQSSSPDGYGQPIESFTEGPEITCGYDPTGGVEVRRSDMTTDKIDGVIRLPVGTVIKATDHFKLTRRFNVAITPIEFDIIGAVQRGPSGVQIQIQRVTP